MSAAEDTKATAADGQVPTQEQMLSLVNAAGSATNTTQSVNVSVPAARVSELDDDVPMTFPQKLMEIVSDERNQDCIGWLNHGKGFIIYKKKKFAAEILPRYFKQSKYTSFTRKLNRWGFTRVTRGPETGAYYHKFFQRGHPRLCMQMSCQSAKSQQLMAQQMSAHFMGIPTVNAALTLPKGVFAGAAASGDQNQQHLIRHQLQQLQLQQLQLQQMQMQQHQQQLHAAEVLRQNLAKEEAAGETPAAAAAADGDNKNKVTTPSTDSNAAAAGAATAVNTADPSLYLQTIRSQPLGLLPALQATSAMAVAQQVQQVQQQQQGQMQQQQQQQQMQIFQQQQPQMQQTSVPQNAALGSTNETTV